MMKNRRVVFSALTLVLICLSVGNLHAQVTFDWATVGNPGNVADRSYGFGTFGAVAAVYRISKHAVTNDQYAEFLNSVAASDPNGLFNASMDITRSGSDGNYNYGANMGFGRNPVNYVSFFDGMRFVNWLENSQGSGDTESGVYTISDGLSESRVPGATFFIPSEDEWYKAAYHDSRSEGTGGPPGDDNYWLFPTQGNTSPTCVAPPGVANSANCGGAVGDTTGVGAYTNTTNFYGTFDQGGNVWEWSEAVVSSARVQRGGSWDNPVSHMAASNRSGFTPSFEGSFIGFRVAGIPEPSASLLLGLGSLTMVGLRRRTKA